MTAQKVVLNQTESFGTILRLSCPDVKNHEPTFCAVKTSQTNPVVVVFHCIGFWTPLLLLKRHDIRKKCSFFGLEVRVRACVLSLTRCNQLPWRELVPVRGEENLEEAFGLRNISARPLICGVISEEERCFCW